MAKTPQTIAQAYPRVQDPDSPEHGLLAESKLVAHQTKIPVETIKQLILEAIENASKKSSREILSIPVGATESQLSEIHRKAGRELLSYFKKYCGDPAATTHQIYRKHYREVGIEQFRNRTLQKERKNSGWRYQFLSRDCAVQSKRFKSVSDLGAAEADFYATYSCEEMMHLVLDVLLELQPMSPQQSVPDEVLEAFGKACAKAKLVDENGYFNDPYALIDFFCN